MSDLKDVNTGVIDGLKAKIIFIHGLLGSADKTWKSIDKAEPYWPKWLVSDFPNCRISTVDYNTNISNWFSTSMPREDIAVNISSLLATDTECQEVPVVLIGHSLGGLIIKQIIRHIEVNAHQQPEYAKILGNIKLIVFLGTPQLGSPIAIWGVKLRSILRTSAITQSLEPDHPGLRDLNNWYRMFASGRFRHLVLSETLPTRVLGVVVGQSSSDPSVDNATPIPIEIDHSGICKPVDRNDQIYILIKRSISACLSAYEQEKPAKSSGPDDQRPVFRRKERQSFASRISGHKEVVATESELKPFVVLLCAPSTVSNEKSGSAKLGLKIRDALVADKFEVVLGEDDGINDPRISSTGNSAIDEFEFVKNKCNAVVILADSIGTFCTLGIVSWNLANDHEPIKEGVDFIVLVNGSHAEKSQFFRRGSYAILEGAGKAEFISFESYDISPIVDRLRSRRSFYTLDRRGHGKDLTQ